MIKHFAFTTAALLCFVSQSFARTPFENDPIADAQSVLVKADTIAASVDAPLASDAAPMPQAEVAAPVDNYPAPMVAEEGAVVESKPITTTDVTPIRRSYRSSRRSSGVFSDLMELERRKNAWLRRNILGR